jgi:hypothetical protein
MAIQMIDPEHFVIDSDTSDRKYQVSFGIEGDYFSCTCPAWSISRNRAGGLGMQGHCKHVDAVILSEPLRRVEQEKKMRAQLDRLDRL